MGAEGVRGRRACGRLVWGRGGLACATSAYGTGMGARQAWAHNEHACGVSTSVLVCAEACAGRASMRKKHACATSVRAGVGETGMGAGGWTGVREE